MSWVSVACHTYLASPSSMRVDPRSCRRRVPGGDGTICERLGMRARGLARWTGRPQMAYCVWPMRVQDFQTVGAAGAETIGTNRMGEV